MSTTLECLSPRERIVFAEAQRKAANGSARILSGLDEPSKRRAAALDWRMWVWYVIDRRMSK